jgi:DNA polymerase-1
MTMFGGVHFSPGRPDPENVSKIDHGALPMIRDFHRHGFMIDIPFLRRLERDYESMKLEQEDTINAHVFGWQYKHPKTHEYIPFNIGSRDHLSQLLFEELKVQGDAPIPMTESGSRYEVSEEILQPYKSNPVVAAVITWHKLEKLLNTYIRVLPNIADERSRVHTRFNPVQAATGRLSSRSPNLQNIPKRTKEGEQIRRAFIASPGWVLVSADFSQIEMVWAAHRSQDPTMMQVFWNGEDLHTRTTCNVFGLDYKETSEKIALVSTGKADQETIAWYKYFKQFQRLPCKTVGFGVLYGQTAEGLQASLASEGVFWTTEECQTFIESKFFEVYPGLKTMLDADYRYAMRYAMICDDFGRVRLVPEAKSKLNWIRNEGVRKAGNHPEQASAQGTAKISMARLTEAFRVFGEDVRPLLQIHDQIIVEAREGLEWEVAAVMQHEMENATPLSVPVRAEPDVAMTWAEL